MFRVAMTVLPYLIWMVLLAYGSETAQLVWIGICGLVLITAFMVTRRMRRAQDHEAPPSDEGSAL
ncbi:hypothetical protein BJF83_22235 [Nocardiopsis sp. CNR-923]|nr:hypothetical protein BJF83_22235 [Nocardiopsis sp. CNR-923]